MRYSIPLLFFLLTSPGSFSQQLQTGEYFNLDSSLSYPQSQSLEYKAKQFIRLTSGFAYKPTEDTLHLSIDKSLQFPLPKNTPNGGVFSRQLDVTYTAGTMPGNFDMSPQGLATYSMPIQVPPGTHGLQPSLALTYSSTGANGIVGIGWGLAGLSEIRRTHLTMEPDGKVRGINFDSQDRFALDGNRLLSPQGESSSYGIDGFVLHTEFNPFSRIVCRTSNIALGPDSFHVYHNDGMVYSYGGTATSRVDNADGVHYVWLLNRIQDPYGNYMVFDYSVSQTGEYFITEIKYTGNVASGQLPYNRVVFNYGTRSDGNVHFLKGNSIYLSKRLTSIQTWCEGSLVHTYSLAYLDSWFSSQLQSVTLSDKDGKKMSPTCFGWESAESAILKWDTTYYTSPTLQGPNGSEIIDEHEIVHYGDFNGDGRADFVTEGNNQANPGFSPLELFLYFSEKTSQRFRLANHTYTGTLLAPGMDGNYHSVLPPYDCDGDGIDELIVEKNGVVLSDTNFSTKIQKFVYRPTSNSFELVSEHSFRKEHLATNQNRVLYGDFDGDGYTDIASVTMIDFQTQDKAEIAIVLSKGSIRTIGPFTIENVNLLESGDLNGDGITEFWAIGNTSIRFFGLTKTGNSYSLQLSFTALQSQDFVDNLRFHTGDFNGDGNTDALVYSEQDRWRFYYSDGTSLKKNTVGLPDEIKKQPHLQALYVRDFNRDGKSDILQSYDPALPELDLYTSGGFKNANGSAYFIRQAVTSMPVVERNGPDQGLVFADIDGDGNLEICKKSEQELAFLSIFSTTRPSLMTDISDGLGATTKIAYKSLEELPHATPNNVFGQSQYVKELSVPLGQVLDPDNYIRGLNKGLRVVTEAWEHAAPDYSEHYIMHYEQAKFAVNRRKFLGFKKVIQAREVARTFTETVKSFDNDTETASLLSVSVSGQEASEPYNGHSVTQYITTVLKPYPYQKILVPTVEKTFHTDLLNDVLTEQHTTIDPFTGLVKKDSAVVKATGQLFSTQVTTNTYTNALQNWCNCDLQNSFTVVKKPGKTDFTTAVANTYNGQGFLQSQLVDGHKSKKATVTFARDNFGNTTLTTMQFGTDPQVNRDSTAYDSKGRFAITSVNSLGQTTRATYEPKWGLVKSATDINGKTLSHTFDGFGRITQTLLTSGVKTTLSYDWGETELIWPETHVSRVISRTEGLPESVELYDPKHRKVWAFHEGFEGERIAQNWSYDGYNRPSGGILPFKFRADAIENWIEYYADGREVGRGLIAQATGATFYTLQYSPRQTSMLRAGRTSVSTFDPEGNITEQQNPDGTSIQYEYSTDGQPLGIATPNKNLSFRFDESGDITGKTDPDIGEDSLVLNARGEQVYWENKLGQFAASHYDILGRPDTIEETHGKTIFTYDNADNATGLLTKAEGPGGHTQEIAYDSLQRVIQLKETIRGEEFAFGYEYNSNSQLTKEIYPSGLELEYVYDERGYLKQIQLGEKLIWKCLEVDPRGMITRSMTGNGQTSEKNFDYAGYPTSVVTKKAGENGRVLQDNHYDFDPETGLLRSRTRISGNREDKEEFTFDANERLQKAIRTGNYSNDTLVLEATYNALGQMASKSNAGDYEYGASQKNAVSALVNLPADLQVPLFTRELGYTSFFKPAWVINDSIVDDTLEFEYGYDKERRYSRFSNGTTQKEKIYFGKYEVETLPGGVKRQLHYITGPEGIIAVLVKNGNADSLYYVYTDYLGSWEVVTDESGALTERMYYDAWGSRVDSIGAPVPYTKSFIFDRGFTGHEHHDVFCLINMNGRMYDPVVGVMLSPDRFMTDPLQTDDYNLFAYAWNNPLKYTDPSGWNEDWFEFIDAEGISHLEWLDSKKKTERINGNKYKNVGEEVIRELGPGHYFLGFSDGSAIESGWLAICTHEVNKKPANPSVPDGEAGDVSSLERFIPIVGPSQEGTMALQKAVNGENVAANICYTIGFMGLTILDILTFGEISSARAAQATVSTVAEAATKQLPQGMFPNAGGKIISYATKESDTFFRVYSSNPNGGAFLTKVAPKSSAFAREGLALPSTNMAEFIQKVTVPSGVVLQRSRALRAFGQRGGLEQFQILNYDSRIIFHPGVPLK